jgi:protein gp37
MSNQFNPKTSRRGVEWCTKTVNVIGGCMHDCKWMMPSGEVAICYAKDLAENGVAKAAYPHGFEHHYYRENAIKELIAGKEPELIFCDSMSDMFEANVPDEHVIAVLDAMRKSPHHTYQSLTKAAPRILKFIDRLPFNLWVGVSSPPDWFMGKQLSRDQQERMLRKSLEVLAKVKAETGNIVWMSAEPVSWDLTSVIGRSHPMDWIVIGAASNGRQYFQPDAAHIRNLLDVMDHHNPDPGMSVHGHTPVFFKGNIRPLIDDGSLGRWREDFPLRYRDGSSIPAVEARQRACQKHGWAMSRGWESADGAEIAPVPKLPMALPQLF